MLTVKTYLAPSAVHGIGLFALEYIPANSVVWSYNPAIDKIFNENKFIELCRAANDPTLHHLLSASYRRGGRFFYLTDNARFINHSKSMTNIGFVDDYHEITLRSINANEEILENYMESYDTTDFFFQEMNNPDPLLYLQAMQNPGYMSCLP